MLSKILFLLPKDNPIRQFFDQHGSRRQIFLTHTTRVAIRSVGFTTLLIMAMLLLFRQLGTLQPFELLVLDYWTQLKPDLPPDDRLLIVAITEQDLKRYGWPIPDAELASTIAALQSANPRVIGLDIYRDPIGQKEMLPELLEQFAAPNLIAIENFIDEIAPPPNVPKERTGFNDLVLDYDGIIRRNLMFVGDQDNQYYSLALRLSLTYLQSQDNRFSFNSEFLQIGSTPFIPLEHHSGGYQTVDANGYQVLLRYRSSNIIAPEVSLSEVLEGQVNPNLIYDRVVLVGIAADSIPLDVFETPYNITQQKFFRMPGVLIHAQALSQILDQVSGRQALYQFWPNGLEILWLFIWVLMGSTLTWQFRRSWMLILQVGIGLLVTIGTSGFLFSRMVWIPTVEPALGFLLASSISLTHTLLNRMTRDPVTGLLNREMFVRYLNRHIQLSHKSEEHSELTVFFLGIDRFKFINDSMGHYWGDRFLNIIGARLRAYLPKNACLARVGGDEFAVALPLQGIQTAPARADQMQELLATPCELNNQELAATVSVGIAFAPPGYLYNPNDLIRDAHLAMYRAKSMPRSHYELFSVGMREEVVNRLELENDLRKALKAQEFVLYYQPIVCLQTLKIRGFEALVRWKSSTRDLVSPGLFIPLAEETGLILPLGQWILTEACRQVKQWQVQFPDDTPLMMSINLSGRQFDQTNLAEQVEAALSEFQIDPRSIKLEITESMVMQDTQSAIDQMLRLKALNLKLGIDDFGTGYSSLSYMQRFPVDTLKIDRSFVNEMQDSPSGLAIVRTIITLAHELGMDAIAEGIETEFELKALQNLQCEFAQGFLLSKPLSSSDATKLLTLQFEGKEPLRQRKKS